MAPHCASHERLLPPPPLLIIQSFSQTGAKATRTRFHSMQDAPLTARPHARTCRRRRHRARGLPKLVGGRTNVSVELRLAS